MKQIKKKKCCAFCTKQWKQRSEVMTEHGSGETGTEIIKPRVAWKQEINLAEKRNKLMAMDTIKWGFICKICFTPP